MSAEAQTTLVTADAYARKGLPVLPLFPVRDGQCGCGTVDCRSPGKHPVTQLAPRGLLDATTDASVVAGWWQRHPDANVGIRTGAISRLLVLDVDPRHGGDGSLAELERNFGPLPATLTARTGGGGVHLLFRHPGGSIKSRTVRPGLDIKADGGYVVAPPSLHASGHAYTWDPSSPQRLAAPPAWLCELLTEQPRSRSRQDPTPIPEGERNSTLTSLGGAMCRRGFSEAAIQAALLRENAERCVPPLPDEEVRRIATSVAQYQPSAPAPTGRHAGAESRPVEIWNADELMAAELPEPRWAVPSVLPEGLAILAGKPKMGKSWLALGLGAAVAQGGMALGDTAVAQGDVLYLALEDNRRRLQDRLRSVLGATAPPASLSFATEWPRMDGTGLAQLEDWLSGHPRARLVLVDTLARVRPERKRQGDAYGEDYAALTGLKALADKYCVCILVVHHVRKADAEDPLDTVSGTLGLVGAADAVLVLRRERGSHDAALLVTGRDVEEQDLALEWVTETASWQRLGDARQFRLSQERAVIVDAVRRAAQPPTPSEVAHFMGKNPGAVRKLMAAMAKDGDLVAIGGGRYTAPAAVGSPVSSGDPGNSGNPSSDGDSAPQPRGFRPFAIDESIVPRPRKRYPVTAVTAA